MLYGPRGSGKTTTARHALAAARGRPGWYGLNVDLASLSYKDVESFWRELGHCLAVEAAAWKLELQPITSAATFCGAFSQSVLGASSKVVIMFDEFDALNDAVEGAKESFLRAVRSIKQQREKSTVQCIYAVGPFNILSMRGNALSPFDVSEDLQVPFLTEKQVADLLAQFSSDRGLEIEKGIVADVYRLTSGHAGLVCACGRALDTPTKVRRTSGRISMADWNDFCTHELETEVSRRATVGRMVDKVKQLPGESRRLLEKAVFYGVDTLNLRGQPEDVLKAAEHLATEGWLLPIGGRLAKDFVVTSPLVRSLALHSLAQQHKVEIKDPLPFVEEVDEPVLDFGAIVERVLPAFQGTVMREATVLSSKLSRATLRGVPSRKRVPSEATYQSQFVAVAKQWFSERNHADLYEQADIEGSNKAADVLVEGRVHPGEKPAPKYIVAFAASNSNSAIREHYERVISYMAKDETERGTCITFTAVEEIEYVGAADEADLEWPSAEQLSKGLVAIHVVHDMAWSRAVVFTRQRGCSSKKREVALEVG